MSTPSAKELAQKFEQMARENSTDANPPPKSTTKSPSTKVLAAKFENISSGTSAPSPKPQKKEEKQEAPTPKSPAMTSPLTSPLASPPASPLRPKMAFPLGPNMAEEAARARATEALEAGIERQEPEPEPEPEPVAAKSAKFNPKAFGANQPKCPKCDKTVYFAERVVGLNGTEWHKGCLRCESCEKTLGSVAEITDHKGEPYCKVCYAKNFGPKGHGRAGGGTIFHTA